MLRKEARGRYQNLPEVEKKKDKKRFKEACKRYQNLFEVEKEKRLQKVQKSYQNLTSVSS